MPEKIRCEGWTRNGGAFTLGPVTWEQCPNDAVVTLELEQKNITGDKEITKQPACLECWTEAKKWPINILSVELIPKLE